MRVLRASHAQCVFARTVMLVSASGDAPHASFQLADGVSIPKVFHILSCGFILE
jgi:hypothetical protein